mgnify:CR=1 FL=1
MARRERATCVPGGLRRLCGRETGVSLRLGDLPLMRPVMSTERERPISPPLEGRLPPTITAASISGWRTASTTPTARSRRGRSWQTSGGCSLACCSATGASDRWRRPRRLAAPPRRASGGLNGHRGKAAPGAGPTRATGRAPRRCSGGADLHRLAWRSFDPAARPASAPPRRTSANGGFRHGGLASPPVSATRRRRDDRR